MSCTCYRGDRMNYLLTLRNDDIPSVLLKTTSTHQITEVRAWVTPRPEARWVEVECLCGGISREGGPQDYLTLAKVAWAALCGARSPASA